MNLVFADSEEQAEVCARSFVCTRSTMHSLKQTNSPFLHKITVKCFGKNFPVEVKIHGFFHPEAVDCQKNLLQNVTAVLEFS